MRGINLSRRPFVNRRPVTRVMVILWILAGLLMLVNLRLFQRYLSESKDIRGKIAEADQALRDELEGLSQLDGQIARVSLGQQNRQSLYLNSLISYRTFPWSALFDDLEQVIPPGVRLLSVRPVVRLASEEALSRAEEASRQEARQRSRRRRSRTSSTNAVGDDLGRTRSVSGEPSERGEAEPPALDEVRLELNCVALDEDSLITFLETLYENPQFRRPLLRGESYSGQQVSFSLVVLYRTGKRFDLLPADDAPDGAAAEEAPDTETGVAAEPPPPQPRQVAADDGATEATPRNGDARSSVRPPPPPTAPPPARVDDERRSRQIDEEVAAARRAARARANAEEQRQNEAETDRTNVIDQRRLRLEELRRRARERRESQNAGDGGLVATPGARRPPPPSRGGTTTRPPRPTGTGGARQPPPSRNPALEDDPPPASPETPASGSPRIGGMATLGPGWLARHESEVRA